MAALAPILAARTPLPELVWEMIILPAFATKQDRFKSLVVKGKMDGRVKSILEPLLDFSGGAIKVQHKLMDDFLRSSKEAKTNDLLVNVPVGHRLIAQRATDFQFKGPTWEPLVGEAELFLGGQGWFHWIEVLKALVDTASEEAVLDMLINEILNLDKLMRSIWAAKQDSNFHRLVQDVERILKVAEARQHNKLSLIKFTLSLLILSERAVMNDPREFAGQILGQVMIPPFDEEQSYWVEQAQKWIKRASEERNLAIAVPMCFGQSGLHPVGTSLLRVLRGHFDDVLSVAISPDYKFIVTGSRDKTARVWDYQTGRKNFCGHFSRFQAHCNRIYHQHGAGVEVARQKGVKRVTISQDDCRT